MQVYRIAAKGNGIFKVHRLNKILFRQRIQSTNSAGLPHAYDCPALSNSSIFQARQCFKEIHQKFNLPESFCICAAHILFLYGTELLNSGRIESPFPRMHHVIKTDFIAVYRKLASDSCLLDQLVIGQISVFLVLAKIRLYLCIICIIDPEEQCHWLQGSFRILHFHRYSSLQTHQSIPCAVNKHLAFNPYQTVPIKSNNRADPPPFFFCIQNADVQAYFNACFKQHIHHDHF